MGGDPPGQGPGPGGPLRAWPAMLLVRSRLAGALAGGQAFVGAVGGALLGVDPVALDRAELLL